MKRKVKIVCQECLNNRYTVNKSNNDKRIEIKKFCRSDNSHTIHKEEK
ncbi:MAG: 50S ribosomal protein L33 [Mollicutes bacterium PWAP]|nr:50S ribosomal protein L33 [Mollicutes bacterium PWAP]